MTTDQPHRLIIGNPVAKDSKCQVAEAEGELLPIRVVRVIRGTNDDPTHLIFGKPCKTSTAEPTFEVANAE
jgi:hypothetical protein